MRVSWPDIDKQLVEENGSQHLDSQVRAQQALSICLGEESIYDAIECYLNHDDGSELVKSVLKFLQPPCAMAYCYEQIKNSSDIKKRQSAAELLSIIADQSVLPWLSELLESEDDIISFYTIILIEQLLRADMVFYQDIKYLVEQAIKHPQTAVRQSAGLCRGRYSPDSIIPATALGLENSSDLEFELSSKTKTLIHGDKLALTYPDNTSALYIVMDHQDERFNALTHSGDVCNFKHLTDNRYVFTY